jgi:hypothetical protein
MVERILHHQEPSGMGEEQPHGDPDHHEQRPDRPTGSSSWVVGCRLALLKVLAHDGHTLAYHVAPVKRVRLLGWERSLSDPILWDRAGLADGCCIE